MRRSVAALPTALVAVSLLAANVIAAPFPATIDLPDGWRPEGIAVGRGPIAYVGSLADGGIAKVDLRTGVVDAEFVASATGPAVGLEYEAGADRLWVAGGPSGEVRVYDATSGQHLETYAFSAGFVNDLVVTADAVYATDSFVAQVLVVPLGVGGSLPDPADVQTVEIVGDFVYVDGFNANGIEWFAGWLIVPQSNTGRLFAIDPATGDSLGLLAAGAVTAADGILLVGSTLYVVRNQLNEIAVYRFHGGAIELQGTITSGDLDVPTTVAFAAGSLWAANARFSTPPTPDTAYWITRLPTR